MIVEVLFYDLFSIEPDRNKNLQILCYFKVASYTFVSINQSKIAL